MESTCECEGQQYSEHFVCWLAVKNEEEESVFCRMLGVFSLEDDGKCQDCEQFDVGSGMNKGSRVDDFECEELVEG